jgi:hypothetical protein
MVVKNKNILPRSSALHQFSPTTEHGELQQWAFPVLLIYGYKV